MSRITQVHRILEQKHLDAIIILSDYNRSCLLYTSPSPRD
ncbi:hypothetical protein JMUB7546_26990 [Staphylococcus aureus]